MELFWMLFGRYLSEIRNSESSPGTVTMSNMYCSSRSVTIIGLHCTLLLRQSCVHVVRSGALAALTKKPRRSMQDLGHKMKCHASLRQGRLGRGWSTYPFNFKVSLKSLQDWGLRDSREDIISTIVTAIFIRHETFYKYWAVEIRGYVCGWALLRRRGQTRAARRRI